jgi:hypothetical protein
MNVLPALTHPFLHFRNKEKIALFVIKEPADEDVRVVCFHVMIVQMK